MEQKVIAFNLYGTLIDNNNEIIGGERTLELLKQLQQKGYDLVIFSNCLDHDIEMIAAIYELSLTAKVSQNGAICNTNNIIKAYLLDKQESLRIAKLLETIKARVELNTISNRYWLSKRESSLFKEQYDSHHIVTNFEPILKNQPCVTFIVIGEQEELLYLQKTINQNFLYVKAIFTTKNCLEIINNNVFKSKELKRMFPKATIHTITNITNDLDIFINVDVSYNVGKEELPEATYHVDTIFEALLDIERHE